MRAMLRILVVALAPFWAAGPAGAATVDGLSLPDTYPVAGQTLKLNGMGVRTLTIFNVRIYVAGLYLAQPSRDARQILASTTPKVILLQFLRHGSKADVEKQYRAGESVNCGNGGCEPADEPDFEALVKASPGVEAGDTTTFIIDSHGVRVLSNNRTIGDFANKDLAFHLLAGFIGDHPPSISLRQHLLGIERD